MPPGTLDVGDGYLDVATNKVMSYDGATELREADEEEQQWAVRFCRSDTAESALALRPEGPIQPMENISIVPDDLKRAELRKD